MKLKNSGKKRRKRRELRRHGVERKKSEEGRNWLRRKRGRRRSERVCLAQFISTKQ